MALLKRSVEKEGKPRKRPARARARKAAHHRAASHERRKRA
jgi:hypothetical protein